MRVIKSAPQSGEIFSHEAPTAKVLVGLAWFFLGVSALTVTAAWKVFLQEQLNALGWVQWPVVILWGLLFVLPIEVMIFELSKYFWRSLVKGYHWGEHAGQFSTACVLLLLGVSYSFFMSQTVTKRAMLDAAPTEKLINTEEIERAYQDKVRAANNLYSDQAGDVEKRYGTLRKGVQVKYGARVDSLTNEHAMYTRKGEKRYAWKLSTISRAMAAANTDEAKELEAIAAKEAGELEVLSKKRDAAIAEAAKTKAENLEIASRTTKGGNEDVAKFAAVFSTLVSWVAALSVVFVFMLARFIELFYHRTGMKRVVLSENADLYGSAVVDLVRFPFVYVTRHLSIFVDRAYKSLPPPPPPPAPEVIYDPNGATQQVVNAWGTAAAAGVAGGSVPAAVPPPSSPPAAGVGSRGPAVPPPPPPAGGNGLKKDGGTTPPAPAEKPDPVSLKGSKAGGGDDAKNRRVPEGVDDVIKNAWCNPVAVAGFYETLGTHPEEFPTAFAYLEKVKKTARNCAFAIHKNAGKEATRKKNERRLEVVKAELGRMCVDVVDAGPGTISFEWLTPEGGRRWEERILSRGV